MDARKTLFALAIGLAGIQTAAADNANALVGNWKLKSWVAEEAETKDTKPVFGQNPSGFLVITREGRLVGLLTAEGRKAPQSDAEREVAYRTMLAYSGRYRVEGRTFITKVDVSWNEAWVGTEQAREFTVDGRRLEVRSPPSPNPLFGGKPARGIFVFEKETD